MGLRSIIVAYSKIEDARKIRNILRKSGLEVVGVCTTGAQVLGLAGRLEDSVVVCGYRLNDMIFLDLAEELPPGSQILLVTSPNKVGDEALPENVVFLGTPLKPSELVQTLTVMTGDYQPRRKTKRPERRTKEEQENIDRAKALLMERNHMTEPEAHHYLQRGAMDSGTKIAETAEMILLLAGPV
jgi:response regulator NasT